MRVFVADDSTMLRERIIGLLAQLEGIEIVGQAHNAREALEAILELKPDVVTLDIQMIGGSGIEVLQKIKQDGPEPIIIVLTNSASQPYRKRCSEAGADFFLDKSTEFVRLREIFQNLVENVGSQPVAQTS